MKERAAAIVLKQDAVLLIKRRKYGVEYYTLPGGGIEEGETAEEACIRELSEEAGLKVKLHSLLCAFVNDGRKEFYFGVVDTEGEVALGGEELERNSAENHYELQWIKISDLEKLPLRPERIRHEITNFWKASFPSD